MSSHLNQSGLALRFQSSAGGNCADQKNHERGGKRECANTCKPDFGSPSDNPRQNAEYSTDSKESDHLFVCFHKVWCGSLWPNDKRERWEPAAGDARVGTDLNGWLPSAPRFG